MTAAPLPRSWIPLRGFDLCSTEQNVCIRGGPHFGGLLFRMHWNVLKKTYQAKMKNRAYWHVFSLIGEIELRNLWNPLFLCDRVWLDEKARFSYSCTRFSCALPRPSSSTFYRTLTDENFHQRQPALLSPVLQAISVIRLTLNDFLILIFLQYCWKTSPLQL